MRFVWPAERYDRLTTQSVVLAAGITASASMALALPIVTIYRAANGAVSPLDHEVVDVVTLVQPTAPRDEPHHAPRLPLARSPAPPARRDQRVLNSDTSAATAPRAEATNTVTSAHYAGEGSASARGVAGPVGVPVGIARAPVIGAAPPPWRWLPPTQEEVDAAAREQDRRAAEAREQHRPMGVPLGGSLPLPFLSMGPTRAQRVRDSIVNADNLRRLARLAERARAKRDSSIRANTVARADSARPGRP